MKYGCRRPMIYGAAMMLLGLIAAVPPSGGTPAAPVVIQQLEACPSAHYIDANRVAWTCEECNCQPYYPELHAGDKGLCGLEPFETGTWDPNWKICVRHDAMMQAQIDAGGKLQESILKTQATFITDELESSATGAYMLVTGLLFGVVGGVAGTLMQSGRWVRKEIEGDEDGSDGKA